MLNLLFPVVLFGTRVSMGSLPSDLLVKYSMFFHLVNLKSSYGH